MSRSLLFVFLPVLWENKPILGLDIATGLKQVDGLNYTGGKILDPNTGKVYGLKAKLSSTGKRLHMRGYLGVSALGRFLLGTIILLVSRFDYALKLKLRDNRAYVSVCQLN
jgi:hypothetical protein